MAGTWKKLHEEVRAKRTKKELPKDHRQCPKGEELTVQRLLAEVSGEGPKIHKNRALEVCALRRSRRDDDRKY